LTLPEILPEIYLTKEKFIERLTKEILLSSGSLVSTFLSSNLSLDESPSNAQSDLDKSFKLEVSLEGTAQHGNIFLVISKTTQEVPILISALTQKVACGNNVHTITITEHDLHRYLSMTPNEHANSSHNVNGEFRDLTDIMSRFPTKHSLVFFTSFSSNAPERKELSSNTGTLQKKKMIEVRTLCTFLCESLLSSRLNALVMFLAVLQRGF
jgi:hypothetical protein